MSSIITNPTREDLNFLKKTGKYNYHWQGIYGQGIKVAVIDTGIAETHPEFSDINVEVKNTTYYGRGVEDNGHGTHCCGTIGGKTVGIAPQVSIVSYKALDVFGGGHSDDVCEALEDIVSRDDIDIVSMSLAFPEKILVKEGNFNRFYNLIKECISKDIAVIVACGNHGESTEKVYPSYWEEPITVGSTDSNLNPSYFSWVSDEVDLAQIGQDICSAWFEGGYKKMSGTSMATPVVVGIASLIASKYKLQFNKRISENLLYEMLLMHSIDIWSDGYDNKTGYGFCTLKPSLRKIEVHLNTSAPYDSGKDENTLWLDGKENIEMPQAPILFNSKALVPIREPFEALDMEVTVDWGYVKRIFVDE